jgi:hypothetical protein
MRSVTVAALLLACTALGFVLAVIRDARRDAQRCQCGAYWREERMEVYEWN